VSRTPRHLLALVAVLAACAAAPPARRAFRPFDGERFIGNGICYGPHRDGQRPGGAAPTREQLREDLAILRGHFDLLRVYGSDVPTPELLAVVREEKLPLKVLLGAWIEPEPDLAARERNRAQVDGALRLAKAYPDVVLAVVIGNETQVSWSAHRMAPDVLVHWVREARRGTSLPVSTADDYAWWVLPESAAVARELDFIVMHVHPLWNGQQLERALAFTQEKYAAVTALHPGLPVLLGESGWATRKHVEGEQATMIKGVPGEEQQKALFDAYLAWVKRDRIPSTWFEAFDESWKGGPHPDEVEKHWGLFNADRTPKQAMRAR
jgi:exo-beta-1,3-glucanase (GH17 family)